LYLGVTPSRKAVAHARQQLKRVLAPQNQDPLPEVIRRLNRALSGWGNYFSLGRLRKPYRAIDKYLYEQLRRFLRRRHKGPLAEGTAVQLQIP
jgi:hypothetical protein